MAAKTKTIKQGEFFPSVRAQEVYDALLDGKKHSKLIGSKCTGKPTVGSKFTAWDGYIAGKNIELEPSKRILQEWETTEWPEGAEPSLLEWTFTEKDGGTKVTLVHSKVPAEQTESYRQGWIDFYWTPMKAYFEK
ncbi:MAG: SRPBCC domain-containing protein [Bryobacteraceae bacterium]